MTARLGWPMATALLLCGTIAAARSHQPAPPPASGEALQPVLACRSITDSAARLACFDKSVGALQDATEKKDIVVIDQKEITKVRRSLFGFGMPTLDVFSKGKGAAEDKEESEMSSTLRTATRDAEGNWIVTLDDGAIWHQTGGTIGGAPRAGETVVIRRAALTSYFMRIGNRPGVKARREG